MTFYDLHHADKPLLLPNAWDVASALAFHAAGFTAIGTTSFGVAASTGRPDGGRSSKEGTTRLAQQLAKLPAYVSVDIEDGYDDDPETVAGYVSQLAVAGINIEDSTAERLIAPDAHAAKIAAIKNRSPDLFVNARVDTYWLGQDATVAATLERAATYEAAGADGIFVPGAGRRDDIAELAANIGAPLNVLATPGLSISELGELGVRRISTGSLPYRAAIDAAVQVARNVRDGVDPAPATAYPEMQNRLVDFEAMK